MQFFLSRGLNFWGAKYAYVANFSSFEYEIENKDQGVFFTLYKPRGSKLRLELRLISIWIQVYITVPELLGETLENSSFGVVMRAFLKYTKVVGYTNEI